MSEEKATIKKYTDLTLLKELEPYVMSILKDVTTWTTYRVPVLDILNDHSFDFKGSINYCLHAELEEPDLNNGEFLPNSNDEDEFAMFAVIQGVNNNKDTELQMFLGPLCFSFLDAGSESSGALTFRGEDISRGLVTEIWENKLYYVAFDDKMVKEHIKNFNERQGHVVTA